MPSHLAGRQRLATPAAWHTRAGLGAALENGIFGQRYAIVSGFRAVAYCTYQAGSGFSESQVSDTVIPGPYGDHIRTLMKSGKGHLFSVTGLTSSSHLNTTQFAVEQDNQIEGSGRAQGSVYRRAAPQKVYCGR